MPRRCARAGVAVALCSVSFFKSVYMLATGPLAWAIPVWRNSLVFHDIDKITSIFIHAFPGMLVFCMRWYPNMHNQVCGVPRCRPTRRAASRRSACMRQAVCVEDALQLPYATDAERVSVTPLDASANGCAITWYEGVVQPLLFYLLWQAAYVVKTDIWDAPKIKADPSIAVRDRPAQAAALGRVGCGPSRSADAITLCRASPHRCAPTSPPGRADERALAHAGQARLPRAQGAVALAQARSHGAQRGVQRCGGLAPGVLWAAVARPLRARGRRASARADPRLFARSPPLPSASVYLLRVGFRAPA